MSSTTNLYPAPGAAPTTFGQGLVSVHPSQAPTVAGGAGVSMASPTPAGGSVTSSGNGQEATLTGTIKSEGLRPFEGFLRKAGQVAGVVLKDIVKYVIPIASIVSIADPSTAPVVGAFTASVKLVQATVISVQQKWTAEGSAANAQKLADVLEIVEQPVTTMFAQVGLQVDNAYVTNLVNGVVAILNAQPGLVLPAAA